MRYAVLSDVHANLEALTSVLDAAAEARTEKILCLGDLVGYGADPGGCLERLRAAGAVMVAGNHEHGCLGTLDLDWFNGAARAALEWTREQLSVGDLDALRRLPLHTTEGPCTLVHGTLRHPGRFEYLVDIAQAVDIARMCKTLFCLVGHTHVPCAIEYDRRGQRVGRVVTSGDAVTQMPFTDDPAGFCYVVNPGSVGQPRDGDPRASFLILDTTEHRLSIERVPYDVPAAQRKIREAGLPGFLADRLAAGR